MAPANYITACDAMDGWRNDVLTGKTTTFYRVADSGPLARIKIGPKLTTLIGGAPGAGKTAFVTQGVVDALGLILTGLRKNELRTLSIGDLSFGDVPFLVLRSANEKNRKGSTVPLARRLTPSGLR